LLDDDRVVAVRSAYRQSTVQTRSFQLPQDQEPYVGRLFQTGSQSQNESFFDRLNPKFSEEPQYGNVAPVSGAGSVEYALTIGFEFDR
jgi:hypothetical protein